MYIKVPKMMTIRVTESKKTIIFGLEDLSAICIIIAPRRYLDNLKTLKILMSRIALISTKT